jgi:hypothetical protein
MKKQIETKIPREYEQNKFSKITGYTGVYIVLFGFACFIIGAIASAFSPVGYYGIGVLLGCFPVALIFIVISNATSGMEKYSTEFVKKCQLRLADAYTRESLVELRQYMVTQAVEPGSFFNSKGMIIRLSKEYSIKEILRTIETRIDMIDTINKNRV